jgi:predicted RNA-binding Zn-ribbon protein involved in translation (DUF1610 family)
MTKDTFIKTVKSGIHYQTLAGNIMTYLEYANKMICPFCGKEMTKKLGKKKLESITCTCEKSKIINNMLNELIVTVEKAQDSVQEILNDIDRSALDTYKKFYIDIIYPMILNEVAKEKDDIVNCTF